jgi:DNA repair protein RadC
MSYDAQHASLRLRIRELPLGAQPVYRIHSAALIVAHNHPSGDVTPSTEDILVTRQIIDAGKLLDVEVLDHLVIGQGRWASPCERGLGGFTQK